MNYYKDTPPLEFISDVYGVMKDGDCLAPEKLNADIVDMLGKYLSAQQNMHLTSVVNSMSGEITLPDGGVCLAFSDEIEAVEQGVHLYKTCPSCTWRMEIELQNGVCPQCGVNWHELQAGER